MEGRVNDPGQCSMFSRLLCKPAVRVHDLEPDYTDHHGTDITSLVSIPRAMHGGAVSATQSGLYNIILLQLLVWQTTFPECIIPGLPLPTNGHLQSCIHGVVPSS